MVDIFISKKECNEHEKSLETFKAEIQFMMKTYENAEENLGLDKEVAEKLNALLIECHSLTTFYASNQKKYILNAKRMINTLQWTREMITSGNLEKSSGLSTAQKIAKRNILYNYLARFQFDCVCDVTYRVRRKKIIIGAGIIAFAVACITTALALILLLAAPSLAVITILSFAAIFAYSAVIIGGVMAVLGNLKNPCIKSELTLRGDVTSLFTLVMDNINRQAMELEVKAKQESFFDSACGIESSVVYRDLAEKHANKLAALKEDLEMTKKEREAINEAHVATLTLIQKHLTPENVKEAKLEMKATGCSTNPHYVYLEHRFQQEVAKKLCAKKIEALETAIELHQGNHVIKAKYDQYRQKNKMEVKTDPLHYTVKRMGDALFLWQENKAIKKTASKMVDNVVQEYQKEAAAEIAECRKTWF